MVRDDGTCSNCGNTPGENYCGYCEVHHLRIVSDRLRTENANLKAATQGHTFFHSDEIVNRQLGHLRSDNASLTAEMARLREELSATKKRMWEVGHENEAMFIRAGKSEATLAEWKEQAERWNNAATSRQLVINKLEQDLAMSRASAIDWAARCGEAQAQLERVVDESAIAEHRGMLKGMEEAETIVHARMDREEYGHAKAAVALDAEAIRARIKELTKEDT